MFISALELFKIGIGPSSSHTMGPMIAAGAFLKRCRNALDQRDAREGATARCILKGSLAYTGKGHGTDRAVALGLHGYTPASLAGTDVDALVGRIWAEQALQLDHGHNIAFSPADDIVFDRQETLPQHPNGIVFQLLDASGQLLDTETYFSIGGGFVATLAEKCPAAAICR